MHSKLALEEGLDREIVDAIAAKIEPQTMSEEEKAVYRFCRDMHTSGRASDESFESIRKRFGLDGVLELIALNGYYTLMAMVLNTAGLPLPGDAEPPLKPF
jgi:4-carboxymuconolactone decarboxylase